MHTMEHDNGGGGDIMVHSAHNGYEWECMSMVTLNGSRGRCQSTQHGVKDSWSQGLEGGTKRGTERSRSRGNAPSK